MKFTTLKLVDCEQHGPQSELFIVEGDSAARTQARVRNPVFQAVLPMQGKCCWPIWMTDQQGDTR